MITIYTNPETGEWHWQSSLLERSRPFPNLNNALNDIAIELRAGSLDPQAEAALEALADQQAAEVLSFMEETGRQVDAILAGFEKEASHA